MMSYTCTMQGAKWNRLDEGNIWMEASHLSNVKMSSSNRHLEIIWKRAYEYHPQYEKRLVINVIESKEQSGIKLTKEISRNLNL